MLDPHKLVVVLQNLLEFVLPGVCVLCLGNSGGDVPICSACENDLPWLDYACERCGIPMPLQHRTCGQCLQKAPAFERSIIAFHYAYPVAPLILGFKHHGNLAYGRVLSELFWRHVSKCRDEIKPDLLIPVPLHKRRQKQRGFNQALEICHLLSRHLQIPVGTKRVQRKIYTHSQQNLSRLERASNLKGCFAMTGVVKGLSVAIVDDVVTTGATVQELAGLLKKAGASRVQIWALARTPVRLRPLSKRSS